MAGGSIIAVGINGRRYAVAADADAQRKMGGWENEVGQNGDGSGRLLKTRVAGSITGLNLSVDDSRGDQEHLQEVADGKDFVPVYVEFASGSVYQGTGQLTGELTFSSQNSTAAVSIMAPGGFTKQ